MMQGTLYVKNFLVALATKVAPLNILKMTKTIIPGGWENRVLLWVHKNSGPNKLQVP